MTFNGYFDAFLVKFDPAGQRVWATYFGGTQEDEGLGIATNDAGDVYIAGKTLSQQNISNNGFDNTFTGDQFTNNGFVAKFKSSGEQLWSSYYSGIIYDLATDNSSNVFMVGFTHDENLAVLGEDQTLDGGQDAFLTKIHDAPIPAGGLITGILYEDSNGDCIPTENERRLSNIVVTTEPSGYFSRTDSAGRYNIVVDPGTYLVKQLLSPAQLESVTQSCPALPGNHVTVEDYGDTVRYDIGNNVTDCKKLVVHVIPGSKVRCRRVITFIAYQNEGYNLLVSFQKFPVIF